MPLVLRVRTQLGTWRLNGVNVGDSLGNLRMRVESEHSTDLQGKPFTLDIGGLKPLNDEISVGAAGLSHGDMIYAMVDETKTAVHENNTVVSRRITKEGHIVTQEYANIANRNGFRPGMMPLRSMKMAWTLNEFISLDSQFDYKIKAQPTSICTAANISIAAINDFQAYMMNFDYRQMRVGYLYGTFNADNSVTIEAIYEPLQNNTDTIFSILEDPIESTVEKLVAILGMRRVGWIFSHPTREDKFHFSGAEIIAAAEQQLLAANGVEETPFVTIKVTINQKNEQISEAYQISKQAMEMVAEGALQPSPNLGSCSIHPTFTAYVEGKPTKEVDNDFFVIAVPIKPFESDAYVSFFPKANREGVMQTNDDMKRQLSKVGKEGWTLQGLISDFHFLLYLCQSFSIDDDMPMICSSVLHKDVPLNEGHELIIRSLADSL